MSNLTARESSVLALIAQGLSNADIAARLQIAEKTVKNVIHALPPKVGVNNGGSVRVRLALKFHGLPVAD